MEIVFKAEDGAIFERKENCLYYELRIQECILIEKQNSYYNYRNKHRNIFNRYLKIKNKTYKGVVVVGVTKSNKYKRKLYWQARNNAKKELIESEKELMKFKMEFFKEVKKYKEMRKKCLNGVENDE